LSHAAEIFLTPTTAKSDTDFIDNARELFRAVYLSLTSFIKIFKVAKAIIEGLQMQEVDISKMLSKESNVEGAQTI
jgi:hypothetical protein